MDGNLNNKVACCFCGESLELRDATILNVQTNLDNDETQQLFCHKDHFLERIHKSIYLHPDFFEDDEDLI
jgi:hypothetical protein